MQWMMGAMKAVLSKDSIQRMTWITYGNQLNTYISDDVPKVYGGNAAPLAEKGITTRYNNEEAVAADPSAAATETKTEPAPVGEGQTSAA